MTQQSATPATTPRLIKFARTAVAKQLELLQSAPTQFAVTPAPNSPFERELQALRVGPRNRRTNQGRLWEETLAHARAVMANVYDHAHAFLKVIAGDTLTLYAHSTLSRTACEAAALVRYLLDASIDHELRITRGAALVYDSLNGLLFQVEQQSPAMQAYIGTGPADEHRALHARITKAGMTIVKTKRGIEVELKLGTQSARLRPMLGQLVKTAFPNRPAVYNLRSGAVHSSAWLLRSVAEASAADRLALKVSPRDIASAAILVIQAGGVVVAAYAAYYGHDGTAEARQAQLRIERLEQLIAEHDLTAAARTKLAQ